jgi:HlyD family secretion protein
MAIKFPPFQYKYLLVLLLIGLLAWATPRLVHGPEVPVVCVRQADLVRSLVASGRVVSPHRVDIGVQMTAQVAAVPVAEGEQVKAGQVLMVLVSNETRAALNQALHAQAQAQIRWQQMAQLQTPVAQEVQLQAQLNLANAKRNVERNSLLFGQGFISEAAKEDAERALQLSQSQQLTAQHQLNSVQDGGSERAAAYAAWMTAQAAAQSAQARLAYTQVTAPMAGTLIARSVEPGDVVQAGKALMVLSPHGAVQLVLQIDEKNLRHLRLKQKALASADAFEDQRFDAEVAFINPSVDPLRGSVEVKLNVSNPPDYLRQDMTVSVDMEVERRNKVLLIPMTAVHELPSLHPWVHVVREGRVVRQELVLGMSSAGVVQVVSGVRQGEQVVSPANPNLSVQARVRPGTLADKP